MNEVYIKEIARGATPSRPESGQGTTALRPEMTALRPEKTPSRPEMREICNADD